MMPRHHFQRRRCFKADPGSQRALDKAEMITWGLPGHLVWEAHPVPLLLRNSQGWRMPCMLQTSGMLFRSLPSTSRWRKMWTINEDYIKIKAGHFLELLFHRSIQGLDTIDCVAWPLSRVLWLEMWDSNQWGQISALSSGSQPASWTLQPCQASALLQTCCWFSQHPVTHMYPLLFTFHSPFCPLGRTLLSFSDALHPQPSLTLWLSGQWHFPLLVVPQDSHVICPAWPCRQRLLHFSRFFLSSFLHNFTGTPSRSTLTGPKSDHYKPGQQIDRHMGVVGTGVNWRVPALSFRNYCLLEGRCVMPVLLFFKEKSEIQTFMWIFY